MPFNSKLAVQWTKAGYEPGMGSACVASPPPSDFIRVYHLTTADFAISDLSLGRLKISRFSDSNDPFELMAFSFDDGNRRQALRKFKDEYDRHTGLLCFSADWTSPVLWSHYGARHRGICLGFDVPRNAVLKVQYTDQRLREQARKINDMSNIDDALRDLLICTKFRHWEYEKEFRVEVPLNKAMAEGKYHFCPFNENLQLAEVILGPLCDLSINAARKLVRSMFPTAITYQARLAIKSFHIVPKESTVP